MNDVLFHAILAMDSYNRGSGAGLNIEGNQLGSAQIIELKDRG